MSVDVSESGSDRTYYDGYDDGYGGWVRKCNEPDYLEGYYDGLKDSGNPGSNGYDYDDEDSYWD